MKGRQTFEVARIIHARACFLIASIRGPHQLPPWLRVWRVLGTLGGQRLLNCIGISALLVPSYLSTGSTLRLRKLSGPSGAWYRWATSSVLNWQPELDKPNVPLIQIHGDADITFPIRYINADVVIPYGVHALAISHPYEVANTITKYITACV